MESAAVLLTCRRCGVPCLMIKAVSDGLTGGGEEYYEALEQSAALCLEVTDRIIQGAVNDREGIKRNRETILYRQPSVFFQGKGASL